MGVMGAVGARSADDEQVYVLYDFPRLDASEVIKARRTVAATKAWSD
jgi:hypothetical protein